MNRDKDNMDQYYDNDLPKEVVELLMKTHPLKDKIENFDEEKYATRFTKAKSQPVEEEYEEVEPVRNTRVVNPTVDDEPVSYTSNNRQPVRENRFQDQDDEEVIKMVKVKPRPQKSSLTYTQRDIDAEEIRNLDKAAELDKFFTEYDHEDEYDVPIDMKNPKVKKFAILAGALGICVLIVLTVATVSLSGKLNKANEELAAILDVQGQNSELKLQINTLEEQLTALQTQTANTDEPDANSDTTPAEGGDANTQTPNTTPATPNTTTPNTTTPPATTADTYTAVSGDSYWSIAAKVYGNGAEYQKILDANGLKESDSIKIGQVFKIPK